MGYVKIKIQQTASWDDLQKWKEHMLEEPNCWNKFCLGLYGENELRAVHVIKEGDDEDVYLTTLCDDCIKSSKNFEALVNESHLIVLPHHDKK